MHSLQSLMTRKNNPSIDKNQQNSFNKYADDTYLLVASAYSHTIQAELDHVNEWADKCNLKLNETKLTEMILHRPRAAKHDPPVTPGLKRVTQMRILGVMFSPSMNFKSHVDLLVGQTTSSIYALRVLRSHGLAGNSLWEVTRATVISRLVYASPA